MNASMSALTRRLCTQSQMWMGLLMAWLFIPAIVSAQAVRVPIQRPLRPQLTLPVFFQVNASASSVTVPLTQGGVGLATPSLQVETKYLLGVLSTVHLYAYFATAAALTDLNVSTNTIAADAVKARCTTGSLPGYTAFTQVIPFGTGAGVQLLQFSAVAGVLVDRFDNVDLEIDLSNYRQQPAGSYRGTLILQAQAF